MPPGRFVLSQLLDLIHRQALDRLADHHNAESRVRHFGCRQQLIAMVFAQLTWREGLRDIVDCLNELGELTPSSHQRNNHNHEVEQD